MLQDQFEANQSEDGQNADSPCMQTYRSKVGEGHRPYAGSTGAPKAFWGHSGVLTPHLLRPLPVPSLLPFCPSLFCAISKRINFPN